MLKLERIHDRLSTSGHIERVYKKISLLRMPYMFSCRSQHFAQKTRMDFVLCEGEWYIPRTTR